ncbi:MAG: GPI anchored serine-threonine rich family protein [Acidobacteriota bacterium]|jgi:hypothetical protein|nr:GPI anchored serine-threonine rich family protein [Acidobacteriota bacterium]
MRRVTLITLFLMLFPLLACADVTSPAAGISWCKGTHYTIHWTAADFPAGKVRLVLRLDGARVLVIGVANAASGSFQWTPPRTLADNSRYQVRVRAEDGTLCRDSGFFTIKNCGALTPHGSIVTPSPSTPGQQTSSLPAGLTTAQPLSRDFSLESIGWEVGDSLYVTLHNTQKVPFSGTLLFRIKALGHDEKLPIQVSLPARGFVRLDLVFNIFEDELFNVGGSDTVEVTVNPDRLVPETNYANNTARLLVATDARVWVEESFLAVTPQTYCGSAYPLMVTCSLRVRARGSGRLTIKLRMPNGSVPTEIIDVSSPGHYTTYNRTVNITIFENAVRNNPSGQVSQECSFRILPAENPLARGKLQSNKVVTQYRYCP